MATAKREAAPETESLYPSIEAFIETATAEEIGSFFGSIKDGLGTLKGPRAENGKKVGKAIERTEELLTFLLQVREKIEQDRGSGGSGQK